MISFGWSKWMGEITEYTGYSECLTRDLEAVLTGVIQTLTARYPVLSRVVAQVALRPEQPLITAYVLPGDIAMLLPAYPNDIRIPIYLEVPSRLVSPRELRKRYPDLIDWGPSVPDIIGEMFFHEICHVLSLYRYYRLFHQNSLRTDQIPKAEILADRLRTRLIPNAVRSATRDAIRSVLRPYRQLGYFR